MQYKTARTTECVNDYKMLRRRRGPQLGATANRTAVHVDLKKHLAIVSIAEAHDCTADTTTSSEQRDGQRATTVISSGEARSKVIHSSQPVISQIVRSNCFILNTRTLWNLHWRETTLQLPHNHAQKLENRYGKNWMIPQHTKGPLPRHKRL